jgi:hypothetical protein
VRGLRQEIEAKMERSMVKFRRFCKNCEGIRVSVEAWTRLDDYCIPSLRVCIKG